MSKEIIYPTDIVDGTKLVFVRTLTKSRDVVNNLKEEISTGVFPAEVIEDVIRVLVINQLESIDKLIEVQMFVNKLRGLKTSKEDVSARLESYLIAK